MSKDPWRASSIHKTASNGRSPLIRRTEPRQGVFAWAPSIETFGSKRLRLAAAAGIAALIGTLIVSPTSPKSSSTSGLDAIGAPESKIALPAVATPEAYPTSSAGPPAGQRSAYYMTFDELDGLPSDIPPWTRIELWVSWDPPITDEPVVHLLNDDAFVEAILAPLVEGGSYVVKLSIRDKHRADLVYADRYGSLNVTFPEN